MPRLTPARAKAQRARVLDAALRCFARDGFQGATMQEIVLESGLSPGAIYGYFAGKTEIVAAIAAERHAMERQRIEDALAGADAATGLTRLIEAFALAMHDPQERIWRKLAVQLWSESLSNPDLMRETLAGVSQAIDLLAPLIVAAQKAGRWPVNLDPKAAARVFVAVLQGISLQLAWDEDIDIARMADVVRSLVVPQAA